MRGHTLLGKLPGPIIGYMAGVLIVTDIDSHADMMWELSRWQLFRFGWRTIWLAIVGTR
jgi:hypothetical protein